MKGYVPGLATALFLFLLSCAPVPRKETLRAKCPNEIETVVRYCPTRHAYSDTIQPMSKLKVISLKTGRSITIAVRRSENVKGLCIPLKYRRLMGGDRGFKARVILLRCGENGVGKCPRYIKGWASWYGKEFHGRKTASGRRFNMYDYVAAHRTLPFGTILLVKNLRNGREVRVEVVDRGPFVRGRDLDLSYGAAKKLGMLGEGVIPFIARVVRCGH